jgi:hypothetical protein
MESREYALTGEWSLYRELTICLSAKLEELGIGLEDHLKFAGMFKDELQAQDVFEAVINELAATFEVDATDLLVEIGALWLEAAELRSKSLKRDAPDAGARLLTVRNFYRAARLANDAGLAVKIQRTTKLAICSGITSRQKRKAAAGTDEERKAIDAAELRKWSRELANELMEAGYPVALQAADSMDPEGLLRGQVGSRRASTIRQRVRFFRRVKLFLLARSVNGKAWPYTEITLVDYLQNALADTNTARSFPEQCAAALGFMEAAGGLAPENRPSGSQTFKNYVNHASAQLEVGADPTEKAIPLMLAAVAALEIYVMDSDNSKYLRAFAWVRLVKLWAALRWADTRGVPPRLSKLGPTGLKLLLDATKTSGAGRKVMGADD